MTPHMHYFFDINTGRVYLFRIDVTWFNQVLNFGDGRFGGHGHHRVEIAGRFAKAQIALPITGMGMNQGNIGLQRLFQDMGGCELIIDHLPAVGLLDQGIDRLCM